MFLCVERNRRESSLPRGSASTLRYENDNTCPDVFSCLGSLDLVVGNQAYIYSVAMYLLCMALRPYKASFEVSFFPYLTLYLLQQLLLSEMLSIGILMIKCCDDRDAA